MASLPSNVNYGTVVGQYIASVADSPDPDRTPDAVPISGEIIFTPSVTYVKNATNQPNPVTIIKTSVVGVLDEEGFLCSQNIDEETGQLQRGVTLVATDDPDLNPSGWTWRVDYKFMLSGRSITSPPSHSINVPTDSVVDLTLATPVASSNGVSIVQGPAGKDGAPGISFTLKGFVATDSQLPGNPQDGDGYTVESTGHLKVWRNGTWIDGGTFRGPQGPEGPAGPRGSQGDKGNDGNDGSRWFTQANYDDTWNVPNPQEGDSFLYTGSGDYLTFMGGEWVWGGNIKGAKGDPGVKGDPGAPGAPNTLSVGTVTTGAPGSSASVNITGSSPNQVINFAIPKGDPGSGGSGGTTEGTLRRLSEFPGANDDERLSAFMSYGAAQTYRGSVLVLDEMRDYTFTQHQKLYTGFAIRGSHRPQDQPRSSLPIGNRVRLRMTGGPIGWFGLNAGNTFGCSFSNLSIDGDANSRLIEGHASGVLWTSVFRDISIQNAASVFGSPSQQLLFTACSVDGWWNINNVLDRAFNIGGSDFFWQPTMMLLDSPSELLPPTKYLASFSSMSNIWMDNIYCTADGHSALLLTGGASANSAWIRSSVWEGRNENTPCPGALIRMTGGQYFLRDNRFAFAMTNPAATGRDDGGVIHQTGGTLVIDGATYDRATGVGEEVPFLYVTGGKARVRNVLALGTWTGKPIVRQAVAGLVDADSTVTLITDTLPEAKDTATGFANSGTSVTVNKPANVVDGDLLVAAIHGRANAADYATPPAGWTAVAPLTDNTAAGTVRFYYKTVPSAAAESATSYTWGGGSSGRHVGVITRVINASLTTPINASGAVATLIGSPDRVIQTAVTTTKPRTLLLSAASAATTAGLTVSFSSTGMTALGTAFTTTGSGESSITMLAQANPAVGSTGTRSTPASGAASTGAGYMIAVNSI